MSLAAEHTSAAGHVDAAGHGIRVEAAELVSYGWRVRATVAGYDDPAAVKDVTPDLVARKGDRLRVVETVVEGEHDLDREAAITAAAGRVDATFYVMDVSADGERVGYDYRRD